MLCVIPARSGSKGITNKNLVDFCGQPLISWTIKAALDSRCFSRIIVSTNNEEIASVARLYGADVPFLRPQDLAEDSIHAVNVVIHALDWVKENEGWMPEAVMMLLPTSPLRESEDIENATKIYKEENVSAVVSVVDLGKYITNLRYIREGVLVPVDSKENLNAQRQGMEKLYGVNGAIFLANASKLINKKTFHFLGAKPYLMHPLRSVDINSQEDLFLAQHIMLNRMDFDEKA
jgi:CMP-N,N'-diacetyllegionaminic acid synthase